MCKAEHRGHLQDVQSEQKKITNTRDVKWSHKLIGEMTTEERKKDDYYTASEDEDEDDSVETTEDGDQTETASNEKPRRSEMIRSINKAE